MAGKAVEAVKKKLRLSEIIRKILNAPFIFAILCYRKLLSPLLPPVCRFHPSCSAYGLQAFRRYPPHYALYLTVWRVLRCNPFSAGGVDHVPPRNEQDQLCECGEPERRELKPQ